MSAYKKILVAVKNPDARSQPGVNKAIGIARSLGASVELFHSITTPVFLELEPLTGKTVAEIKREALQLRRKRLEKLAAHARKRGVKANCSVEWDYPPHEAIVRHAQVSKADLIIAECHQGRRLRPWLIHLTDWELLRTSPLPVLLLKNSRPWREPTILAAIDPSHAHDKPARLDAIIVAEARRLSRALRGSVELMHATYPTGFGLTMADPGIDALTLATVYEQQQKRDHANFEAFARRAHIPRASCQVIDSDPEFAIPHVAKKLGADLVVMGAVSRSGLKRVFIGNTAERVLDDLPCDVLVVKSARTAAHVSERVRGVRLVPTQPLTPAPC